MPRNRGHVIPPSHDGVYRDNVQRAVHDEEEARRAATYRQYCIHASAPIIWPPHKAEQHQQQMAFLWSQLDQRDRDHYLREYYRFRPPYMHPPPLPANVIRGIEPFRLINQRGQMINVVEDIPDDAVSQDAETTAGGRSDKNVGSEDGTSGDDDEVSQSIPMINGEGRVVYLIR